MRGRQLSCSPCRIRIRQSAPQANPPEGACPICGARLELAESLAELIGLRPFELGAADAEPADTRQALAQPIDLTARRATAVAREATDAQRWFDEGGRVDAEAIAVRMPRP